jgi:capsular exopolysaccharide synthesis family protein
MITEDTPLSRFIEKDSQPGNTRSFGEEVLKYLYYWPLFLICILVSLTVAFFYLHYAKPEYIVKAKLLIKAENKDSNPESQLSEIVSPYKKGKSVGDEIEIIKSRANIAQIVKDLDLWKQYAKKGRLVDEDLYKTSPVEFQLVSASGADMSHRFKLIIKDQKSFILIEEDGTEKQFSYSNTLKNTFGSWRLVKTPDFNRFIGSTILVNIQDPEVTADQLLKKIKAAEVSKETSIVELSIQEVVLKRGKDILNRLIDQYNIASENEKVRVAGTALKFIDERLVSLSKELNSVERDVEGFRSTRGLTDISSESKLYLDNVKANDARLNEVDVQLRVIAELERFVNSDRYNTSPPSTIGITEPGLNALVSQLIDVQTQYQRLLGTLPEKNPAFDPLRQQINSTKMAIKENINSMKTSLVATRGQLESFNSGFEGSIRSLPGNERQLVSIKRQQSIKENLYMYLLQKREEAALSNASNLAFSQTIDSAYLDNHRKPLTYSLALLIGMLIPAGLLFGKEVFNNKISSSNQILQTGAPVTSELIYEYSKSPIVFQSKSRLAIGEQIRALRTSLNQLHGGRRTGRVTLVTSSIAGEGKSFVASNLAVALAASGRKTLIVEFDLRKPKVAANFGVDQGIGISDFLNGTTSAEKIVKACAQKNLFVISAGAIPDNPSELLETDTIDHLIKNLREEFDDILIDSPPVYLITDAMLLARLADATLYIIRQNFSFKKHLSFIKRIVQEHTLPNVQVVFNAIQNRGEYRYGYSYYSNIAPTKRLDVHSVIREVSNRLLISNT